MKMPENIDHYSSRLLETDENLQIFKLLGNRCTTMATTIVQLFTTQPPHHSHWTKKETGVLCFVKDNIRKNYFFRLFCLKKNSMVWEHEMYNNMDYMDSTSYLHIFEGEDGIIAFNFADTDEASHLKAIVDQKISVKKKRSDKNRQSFNNTQTNLTTHANTDPYRKTTLDHASKLSKRKRNLTKADISEPSDFKHITHVGWSPESGFDVNCEDEKLKAFFEKAGVSEKQLRDRDTREFIYDFIDKHGGREAAMAETTVTRKAPALPPSQNNSRVPPVPPRCTTRPPHTRAAPPPPPTNQTPKPIEKPALPPPPIISNAASSIPPPPPPPTFSPVNEQIEASVPPPPPMQNNSELMESIRSGTTLKPASERKIAPVENSRNDLLDEIRKGYKLKPVDERDLKPVGSIPCDSNTGVDLAGALARALHERSKAIHSEDDEDDNDSEEFNDEDWD